MNKKGVGKAIVIVAIIVLALIIIIGYISLIYLKTVYNQTDFNKRLYNCQRTYYLSDQESAIWQYKILGETSGGCRVEVSLISVKEGVSDISKLQGLSMNCDVPMGSASSPESNLKLCHGLLKEGMQEIIIERMHAYVTTNLEVLSSAL